MKTAEEWTKEILSCADNISLCEATVREALLEAWKQGMTDASDLTEAWTGDDAFAIRQAIKILRDSKTTL